MKTELEVLCFIWYPFLLVPQGGPSCFIGVGQLSAVPGNGKEGCLHQLGENECLADIIRQVLIINVHVKS